MSYLNFFAGITVATFTASGLFFFKFWKASHDRFFLFFAGACWLLAFERTLGMGVHAIQEPLRTAATEASGWFYCFRLLAFVIILIGVVDKNRRAVTR